MPAASIDQDTSCQNQFFESIETGQADIVRKLLVADKSLTTERIKVPFGTHFDSSMELEAYKFLGAYLGSMTGLQIAILKGRDDIAKDIIDATLNGDDLNITFGGGNTALHLATFLGAKEVVSRLLARGADITIKNAKGFCALDMVDDPEMRQLFS